MIAYFIRTGLNNKCLLKYLLNVHFHFGLNITLSCCLMCCGGLNTDVKLCIGVYLSVSSGERSGKEHLLSV